MINITIASDCVTAAGHALFAERGQDIVCAGVSAIMLGGANAFTTTGAAVKINRKQPSISIKIKVNSINTLKLDVIKDQLRAIAQSYPDHIDLKEPNHEKDDI